MTTRTVELIRREPAVKLIEELRQSEANMADDLDGKRRMINMLVTLLALSFLLNLVLLAVLFG